MKAIFFKSTLPLLLAAYVVGLVSIQNARSVNVLSRYFFSGATIPTNFKANPAFPIEHSGSSDQHFMSSWSHSLHSEEHEIGSNIHFDASSNHNYYSSVHKIESNMHAFPSSDHSLSSATHIESTGTTGETPDGLGGTYVHNVDSTTTSVYPLPGGGEEIIVHFVTSTSENLSNGTIHNKDSAFHEVSSAAYTHDPSSEQETGGVTHSEDSALHGLSSSTHLDDSSQHDQNSDSHNFSSASHDSDSTSHSRDSEITDPPDDGDDGDDGGDHPGRGGVLPI